MLINSFLAQRTQRSPCFLLSTASEERAKLVHSTHNDRRAKNHQNLYEKFGEKKRKRFLTVPCNVLNLNTLPSYWEIQKLSILRSKLEANAGEDEWETTPSRRRDRYTQTQAKLSAETANYTH